jgi:hypothetical protein
MNFFDINLNLRKRKNYFQLHEKAKINLKLELYKKIIFYFNLYLNTFGLKIKNLEIRPFNDKIKLNYEDEDVTEEKKNDSFSLFRKKFSIETAANLDMNALSFSHQSAKDIASMSNINYLRLRKLLLKNKSCQLQSLKKLDFIKKKLNGVFTIKENSFGWFCDPFQKINFVLNSTKFKMPDKKIYIHLSGDGLVITRTRFNLVNFCFKILNETDSELKV